MVERVIFDLDDTLLETGDFYTRQLNQFAEKATSYFENGLTTETVLETQQSIDADAIEEMGMAVERFPESLARTWEHFCRQYEVPVRDRHLQDCLDIGWAVYDEVPEPTAGMEETLDELYDRTHLVLYTMGDPEIQTEKIRHHDLGDWFSEIHVVPRKNDETLKPLVNPLPPDRVAIVGDSLRGEVGPGVKLGCLPIHRETEDQWHYHEIEIDGHYHTVRQLPEVLEVLNGGKQ